MRDSPPQAYETVATPTDAMRIFRLTSAFGFKGPILTRPPVYRDEYDADPGTGPRTGKSASTRDKSPAPGV
jgi:hypothetical protein